MRAEGRPIRWRSPSFSPLGLSSASHPLRNARRENSIFAVVIGLVTTWTGYIRSAGLDPVLSKNPIDAVRRADSTLDARRVATFVTAEGLCSARPVCRLFPSVAVPRRGRRGLDQPAAA